MDATIIASILTAMLGAMGTGIPLWIVYRKGKVEIEGMKAALQEKQDEGANRKQINAENEWRRILDFKEQQLQSLIERDNAQQKELDALQEQHVECLKSEARNSERIKMNEERVRMLEAMILELKAQVIAKRMSRKDVISDDSVEFSHDPGPTGSTPAHGTRTGPG